MNILIWLAIIFPPAKFDKSATKKMGSASPNMQISQGVFKNFRRGSPGDRPSPLLLFILMFSTLGGDGEKYGKSKIILRFLKKKKGLSVYTFQRSLSLLCVVKSPFPDQNFQMCSQENRKI